MDSTTRVRYDNLLAQDGAAHEMPSCPEDSIMDHIQTPHLQRVREICLVLPATVERASHGEPTFFVGKKVFAMFANNHHGDGRIAVWIPVPPGAQAMLIDAAPEKFFKPPYVGGRGWVGIELAEISTEELAHHLHIAWKLIAPRQAQITPTNM